MENTDLLGKALAPIIGEIVAGKMAEIDIQGQIKNMLEDVAKNSQKILTIKLDGEKEGKKFSLVHKQFEQLLQIVAIKGLNVLITGGAGLSKSQSVTQIAEALGLKFGSISFSNQTTKTDLLGFVDAMGVYRESAFVDAFRNGKVFLADEMDACSANVLVLLNSAISNGFLETPANGEVLYAHKNFRFVGTANTNLRGASGGFTARNKLDQATIDRFVVIEWLLDEDLEKRLTDNDGWLEIVRECRKLADRELDNIVITPRSSYDGAKLLRAGVNIDAVIEMTIIKAMGDDARKSILRTITDKMKAKAVELALVEPKEVPKVNIQKEPLPEINEIEIDDIPEDKEIIDDEFNW
jgi:MoxR-like ATPase